MIDEKLAKKYLPLTESTFYILTALDTPLHGYAVMQQAEKMSQGTAKIGPGTLYGAFTTLEKEGLIRMVEESGRRKTYQTTDKGREVLGGQMDRLEIMREVGLITRQNRGER